MRQLSKAIATLTAERTKGRRDVRIELHPTVVDHLKKIVSFDPMVFSWPHPERALWDEFRKLKATAEVDFPGAFHRLRFGFANANVDHVPEDVLQHLMRHKCRTTTRHYVHQAQRMQRQGTADRLHVPAAIANRA